MKRTNIYIDEEQSRLLRHLAVEAGRSFTGLVREALQEYLARRGFDDPSRVSPPPRTLSDAEWRARFDALLERVRARLPTDLDPDEIENEITLAWREVREEASAHRTRGA